MTSYALTAVKRVATAYPMMGYSVFNGTLYGIGDLLAQKIEMRQGRRTEYDWHRTSVFFGFGTVISGPIYHFWFYHLNKLPVLLQSASVFNRRLVLVSRAMLLIRNPGMDHSEKVARLVQSLVVPIPRIEITEKHELVAKVLADQLIFSSIYPLLFVPGTAFIMSNTTKEDWVYLREHGHPNWDKWRTTAHSAWNKLKATYITIFKTDCSVWPMIQLVNFGLFPERFHKVITNIVTVFWNAFLCYVTQESVH